MKVGIITFHFAHNYGAMLQAFALQETIKNMGHDVYIIDYSPIYHTRWFQPTISWRSCISKSPIKLCSNIIHKLTHDKAQKLRYNNFEAFKNKYLNLYKYEANDDFSDFDAIVLGSDQIWNEALTNNTFDGPYYGDGLACKIISYAASSTYMTLNDRQRELFKEKLSKMSAIGVREHHLKSLLQPLTSKPISVNLDPTFLCDSRFYLSIVQPISISRPYVLVYEITPHSKVYQMAKKYAISRGLDVISLVGHIRPNMYCGYDLTASPSSFITYIHNAKCVFTTSFHGTALSIINRKDFFAVKQNNKVDERIRSLLSQLELTKQFIEMDDLPASCHINYDEVEQHLSSLIEESKLYLENALLINKS